MNIGQKLGLVVLCAMAIIVALFYGVQRPMLLEKFAGLQEEAVSRNIDRSAGAIRTEITSLERQTQDWGSWNDTYEFVQGKYEAYRKTNLTPDIYDTSHVDILYIVDLNGKIIHSGARMPDGKVVKSIAQLDAVRLMQNITSLRGLSRVAKRTLSGVQEIQGVPALLAVRPIIDSSETKPPMGALIMGRFMPKQAVSQCNTSVRVKFDLRHLSTISEPIRNKLIAGAGSTDNTFQTAPSSDSPIEGYSLLSDAEGKPSYVIRSRTNPEILQDGSATVENAMVFVILVAFFASIAVLVGAQFLVAMPLARFSSQISQVGEGVRQDADPKFSQRRDEVGSLARSFGQMLEHLASAKEKLVDSSREAGMAQVARGVLHNAGNVLNSISVSVRLLQRHQTESKISGLKRVVSLLDSQGENLGEYLLHDPKGRQVLPYLRSLAETIDAEKEQSRTEIACLAAATSHLNDVIQAQQVFAVRPEMLEDVRLGQIVGDALQVVQKAFERHQVQMEMDLDPSCRAKGDPRKLLQVLVNLLTNSKEALGSVDVTARTIWASVRFNESGVPEIRIKDNGKGIEQGALTKVFQQGFSSKLQGTGFGLHYCANALGEMGWSIHAESEGLGKGATFVITASSVAQSEQAA